MQPIFDYKIPPMFGTKRHELIKVAQENLYMLKRINEKTSFYNVNKWNKEYEASQYYKNSHCQFPSIDFYKTQRASSFYKTYTTSLSESSNGSFFNKNKYKTMNQTSNSFRNSKKKKKKFQDFTYHDLINNDENGGFKKYYGSKQSTIKSRENEEQQQKMQTQNEENNNENDEQIGFKTLNNIDDVDEDKNSNINNCDKEKNNKNNVEEDKNISENIEVTEGVNK